MAELLSQQLQVGFVLCWHHWRHWGRSGGGQRALRGDLAGLDMVAGMSAGPCPSSSSAPSSAPQYWLASSSQGRLDDLPGPGPGDQRGLRASSLPGRRHLEYWPLLLATDRLVSSQTVRAVPADVAAARTHQTYRLVTPRGQRLVAPGAPLQPRPLPGSPTGTGSPHLGDVLHQAADLELLSHAQKPGEVILWQGDLPVVHEVNETGELLVLNIPSIKLC